MPTQYSALTFTDPDEFCLASGSWDIDFRQLDTGPSYSKMERLESVAVVANRIYLSRRFHQRGSAPAGAVTFGLPRFETLHSWMGRPVEMPALLNFSRSSDYDSTSRPAFLAQTVSIADSVFQNIATSTGIDTTPNQIRCASNDFILGQEHLSTLNRALSEWFDYCSGGQTSQFVEMQLQDDFLLSVLAALDDAPTKIKRPHLGVRAKAVDRAVNYIDSTRGLVKMSDVYQQSLTSWRTLDRGFMERFGIGPKKFLTAVRLTSARRALMAAAPTTTIATVAEECGFYHEGRFSAAYKNMFGELPSESRQR